MRPSDRDEDYSTIVLGVKRSPGVVTLSGHNRSMNWDVKSAKGQAGASSTLNGAPVGEFRASFFIVDDDIENTELTQFDEWESFQALLESLIAGSTPVALPVYHPDLALNQFTEVSVKSIGGMLHDGKGGATILIDFIEFKPPKKKRASGAKAKASGSTARVGTTTLNVVDPNAAAKAQLEGLLTQARQP